MTLFQTILFQKTYVQSLVLDYNQIICYIQTVFEYNFTIFNLKCKGLKGIQIRITTETKEPKCKNLYEPVKPLTIRLTFPLY